MVAGIEEYLDSTLHQVGQCGQDPHISAGRNILIVNPEIENVAKQVEFPGLRGQRMQKIHKRLLPQPLRIFRHTQMDISREIISSFRYVHHGELHES